MDQIRRWIIPTTFVILALLAGVAAALRLSRLHHSETAVQNATAASIPSRLTYRSHAQNSTDSFLTSSLNPNILELPKASTDFVGYWGGYIQSTIQSLSPALVGTSPDRVSVVFARRGDTVFMSSELYSARNQRIVHPPKCRIVSPRLAIIEYAAADRDLYYTCRYSFLLKDASIIKFQGSINVYDLNSHRLMGVVTQIASLKRLLTVREQLRFARPGPNQIPRVQVSASNSFVLH
jgi:hypothetical protein